MRYVLVSDGDFLWRMLGASALGDAAPLYVVERPGLSGQIGRRGGRAITGDLEHERVYRRAFPTGGEPAVVAVPARRRAPVLAAIRRAAPDAPVVVLADDREPGLEPATVTTLSPAVFADRVIGPELERAVTRARVDRIRRHFERAERVVIMMQDDPDPDAIASGLALRAVLGREKSAAPLATFGTIGRAENRAMTRILEIDVDEITTTALGTYDAIAMVDTQPAFFEEQFGDVDLVIDHHPEEAPVQARLKDIRPGYGATSTILTEYLRAADAKLPTRLATALLYGIKTDTLYLERGAVRADMEAFGYLHAHADHRALRRIERPELPATALDLLAAAIERRRLVHGVLFAHLGPLPYRELTAQFADLFVQVEGAEWAVVSGTLDDELHVSVRTAGDGQAAGEVVREAFRELGRAGGHRTMAKAVVPLNRWRAQGGPVTEAALPEAISARFLTALRSPRARSRG